MAGKFDQPTSQISVTESIQLSYTTDLSGQQYACAEASLSQMPLPVEEVEEESGRAHPK